jgi:hypothetical protein
MNQWPMNMVSHSVVWCQDLCGLTRCRRSGNGWMSIAVDNKRGPLGEQFLIVDHIVNVLTEVKESGIWNHGGERRYRQDLSC